MNRLIIFAVLILLFSCKDNDQDIKDLKLDYYPLESGHTVVYEVDSIIFSDIALPQVLTDTISFQLMETITDTFTDNSGIVNYRIERYTRENENLPWQFDKVWSAGLDDLRLFRIEDNLKFIKLKFPPRTAENWNGNAFVPVSEYEYLEGWTYYYEQVDGFFEINGFQFDSTLIVNQVDEENLITKRYSVEYYSRKTGLVYKEMMILEKQNINNGWDKPEKGVIVRQSVIDFSD